MRPDPEFAAQMSKAMEDLESQMWAPPGTGLPLPPAKTWNDLDLELEVV